MGACRLLNPEVLGSNLLEDLFIFSCFFLDWRGGGSNPGMDFSKKKPTSYVNIYAINEFLALTLTYRNKKKGLTIFFYKNRDLDSVRVL